MKKIKFSIILTFLFSVAVVSQIQYKEKWDLSNILKNDGSVICKLKI